MPGGLLSSAVSKRVAWRSRVSSPELIEHMISENRQRTGKYPVESLHGGKEKRSLRYPRLGSTGRNRYADAKALFQNKPGSERALKHGAAMINNVEVQIGEIGRASCRERV